MQQPVLALEGGGVPASAVLPKKILRGMGYALRDDEVVVDSFAGAGGMSCAIQQAIGRSPDIAINHDEIAIGVHEANHPDTIHFHSSVYAVNPKDVIPRGMHVGLYWASPDCRSFSRARGKAPKSKAVRDLVWICVHWAETVRPRVIAIENVREIVDYGPLDEHGKVIKSRKGEFFRDWCEALRKLGYELEWRLLNAADYGAPTTRIRLFLQARRDGLPILWPNPTHGRKTDPLVKAGKLQPWRTAGECIDFSLPTHSIFLTPAQAKSVGCKRPLAATTMRRIARGLFKHVIHNQEPYLINYYGEKCEQEGFRGRSMDAPFATQSTANRFGLVVPLTHHGDDRVYGTGDPFRTITGANRGETAYVAPVMVQTGYGERKNQLPRSLDLKKPLGVVVAGGAKHAIAAASLTCFNQNAAGSTPGDPFKTVMAGATRHAYIESSIEGAVDRSREVEIFLWNHRHLSEKPVTRDSLGRVLVDGVPMRITDIGLRMITSPELFKAQGFPTWFDATRTASGRKTTGEQQVRLCGNAVAPPVGEAVIRAIFGDVGDAVDDYALAA